MGTPGTFGNASNLPQIGGGVKKIPQSFLNHIGREIDKSRQTPNQGQISQQTPGGSHIDFAAMIGEMIASYGLGRLPFQVNLVKPTGSALEVTIAEGRIFGRVDFVQAFHPHARAVGTNNINEEFSGPWSDANASAPEPKNNPKDTSKGSPTGNGTLNSAQNPTATHLNGLMGNAGSITSDQRSAGGSYHNTKFDGSFYNSKDYPSGNLGNITGAGGGPNGGSYHSTLPSSKFSNVSGNNASITVYGGQVLNNPE